MASDLAREALDVAALEAAAKASYEYEGDRRSLDYLGWSDEPESVRAQWRDSVRLPIATYQGRHDAIGSGVKADEALTERFTHLSETLRSIETLPRPGDLYYAVKNDGEGTGWRYVASGVIANDIHDAARALSTHTAAGAGPVGEAGWPRYAVRSEGPGNRAGLSGMEAWGKIWSVIKFPDQRAVDEDDGLWVGFFIDKEHAERFAHSPTDDDEPGEVERLRALVTSSEQERYRSSAELLARAEKAEAALVDTRERLEKVEAELRYAAMGLDHIHNSLMTNGPKQASGEMTAHFLEHARAALTGDAQEAGR